MPEFPREQPHIYLHDHGESEIYVSPAQARSPAPRVRDRVQHAQRLEAALNTALTAARQAADVAVQNAPNATPGYYLDFTVAREGAHFVQSLENRQQGIELLTVRPEEHANVLRATVFVPYGAENFFLRRISAYRSEDTASGRPKHERLVANIDAIALAAVRSFFSDDLERFPNHDNPLWWEIWLRQGTAERFLASAARTGAGIRAGERLVFPEREVYLINASISTLARLVTSTDAIAELRLAADTPWVFAEMRNLDQVEWARNLANRVQAPADNAPAVCVLDSGVTHTHQLLSPALDPADLHSYDPTWGTNDSANWLGHGTSMAGVSLYNDLTRHLLNNDPVQLQHRLESVKLLDPSGAQHAPHLYGAVTSECVARVEVHAPARKRAFCLAVTSELGAPGGRPTAWSAEVDALAYADGVNGRLFVLSAGNLARASIVAAEYPAANDLNPVQNPAQSWNSITVGSYTEKSVIADPTFDGWTAIAPSGELSPASRTSITWDRQWPIKPDIVSEGGNWATDGERTDSPDDLAVLTTNFQPHIRQFTTIRDTSAAAATVSEISGRLLAAQPHLWAETLRALIVHSARWTDPMRAQFDAAHTYGDRVSLLRRYGFGVPNFTRALLSSINDATLVIQDSLQPFRRTDAGSVTSYQMNVHRLPWPHDELRRLGETEVVLRVTLSYFIEPNPGERGWVRRHRYASHALRFALKRSLETYDAFRARINDAVQQEEQELAQDVGPENWFFGTARNVGSLHSDIWRGTAADLATKDAVAVFPVSGWWKEKPYLGRYHRDARYALVISIDASAGDVDIYTPIRIATAIPIQIG